MNDILYGLKIVPAWKWAIIVGGCIIQILFWWQLAAHKKGSGSGKELK